MAFGSLNVGKGLFSADKDIYGTKPVVPEFDPYASYAKTIASNLKLEPQAQQLATLTNQGNQAALTGLIENQYPGFGAAQKGVQSNISDEIAGILYPDLVRNIQNQGAIWGQQSGIGLNNPQVDYADLRNYGLTGMALKQKGQADFQNYTDFLRKDVLPSPMDIRDYSINPASANTDEWQRNWLASQIAASPDPAARGQFDSKMAILGMILSAYGGGAGYQGTYRGVGNGQGGSNTIGGGVGGGGGNWWTNSFGGGNGAYGTAPVPSGSNYEGAGWSDSFI
jgi:hypothetical protein